METSIALQELSKFAPDLVPSSIPAIIFTPSPSIKQRPDQAKLAEGRDSEAEPQSKVAVNIAITPHFALAKKSKPPINRAVEFQAMLLEAERRGKLRFLSEVFR